MNKAVSLDNNGLITNIIVVDNTIPEGYQSIDVTPIMGLSISDCGIFESSLIDIKDSKNILATSDWVVTKINEASLKGEDINTLKTKYEDVLINREEARTIINQSEIIIENIRKKL